MDALIPVNDPDFDEKAQAILDEHDTTVLLALRDQYRSDWLALLDVAKGQSDMPIDIDKRIVSDTKVEDTTSVFVSDHYDRDEQQVYLQPPPSFDDVVSTFGSDHGGPDRYSDKDVWSDRAEFEQVQNWPAYYAAQTANDLVEWCEQSLLIQQLLADGETDSDEWFVLQTPLGPKYLPGWREVERPVLEPALPEPSSLQKMASMLELIDDLEGADHYASLSEAVPVWRKPRKIRVEKDGSVNDEGEIWAGVGCHSASCLGTGVSLLPGSVGRPAARRPSPEVHPHATMRRKVALATHTPPGSIGPHHAAYWGGEAIPRRDQGGPLADHRISWLARMFAGLESPPANTTGCYTATVWESFAAWRIWLRQAHTNESLRELGVLSRDETARDLPLRRYGAPRRRWASTPEGEVIVPVLGYEGQDLRGETTGYVPRKPSRVCEGESLARLASDHWVEHFLLETESGSTPSE